MVLNQLGVWLVSIQSCFHTKMKGTRQTANKGVSMQFGECIAMAISFIQYSFFLSSPGFIRDFSCLCLVTINRLSFSLCGETENPYRHSSVRLNLIDEWKNFWQMIHTSIWAMSKLYIPSTPNIDLILTVAKTFDCVCRKC